MKRNPILLRVGMLLVALSTLNGCKKDPFEGVSSNERSIEAFTLTQGQIGPAIVDRAAGKVKINVVLQGLDLTKLVPKIQTSYKSSVSPATGETVNFMGNKANYTVKAESGQTKEWTVEIVPFTETILGTYKINSLVVFGGTGPEYGGGAVLKLADKPWNWPTEDGPSAEEDNSLTFNYVGVNAAGNTHGTMTNSAGDDGKYADFNFIADPKTDVNSFYRTIPKGEGKWERDYAKNTVTFTFADGSKKVGAFVGAGMEDLGNGNKKTITDNAFAFNLNGTDDWGKIYSDYDKFVKHPRKYWIDVKKQ